MKGITRTGCVCPFCGALNEPTTSNQVPQTGDISICTYCQEVGIFAKDEMGHRIVRKPTAKEWVQIICNPQVIQAQIALANFNLKKPKPK